MICRFAEGRLLDGWQLICPGGPAVPWAYAVAGAGIAVSVLLATRLRSRLLSRRLLTAGLFGLAFLLLALATERPGLQRSFGQASGGKIVVLLDQSESFWRDPGKARAALDLAAERISEFLAAMPPGQADAWRGELRGFGRTGTRLGSESSAANLVDTLRRHQPDRLADASNLGAGLLGSLDALRDFDGQRMVVLLTDGLADDSPQDSRLSEFRAAGIPINVIAAGASAPGAGLVAANLGPEHRLGEEIVLRGTVLGGGQLTIAQQDRAQTIDVADSPSLRAVRLGTSFDQRGLQGMLVGFDVAEGRQQRSLFTLVRGPARVLAFGPAPWAEALPLARWRVDRADPMAPPRPSDYDLVVIDGLVPQDFAPGYADDLLAAVDGTGILLVNGGLRGSVTDEQVISAWNESALNPILPVDSDPRLFVQEPPPRDIVIMVDVSGSMGGSRLGSAQSAILAILKQLRPQDSIAILPFSSDAHPPFQRAAATPATLDAARRYIAGLSAGGGTAPESTLQASSRFVSNYCAFFFISDAEFDPPRTAPQCFTTAISVSDNRFPMDVGAWGEEILLGENGNAENLPLRYFEPEQRNEYYREGAFTPIRAGDDALGGVGISVDGLAIAYPRADARVELLHASPPPDPLFAWRRDAQRPGVVTGAFLGPMDAQWGHAALPATEAMLERLLGWPEQDRYLVQLADEGDRYGLAVTPADSTGVIASGSLSATMQWADGTASGVSMEIDPRRGTFHGSFAAPAVEGFQRALLVLQDGANIQRIPVSLPAKQAKHGAAGENLDFGINSDLLVRMRDNSGGVSLAGERISAYQGQDVHTSVPLHHVFLAIAFFLLAAAIWSRNLNPR